MIEHQTHSTNNKFVGRKSELEQFERALELRNPLLRFLLGQDNKAKSKVFLPHGIGGLGKTRLSRECLERAKKARWATIEIDWDRADTRPTDTVDMMNIIAEQLRRFYGDDCTQEFINKQKQFKPISDNVQRLQRENQEKWSSIVDALRDIAEGVGGEKGSELGSAVSGVGKLVNIGADTLARAEDTFTEWLVSTGKMKPDERMFYKDKDKYLSRILVSAIAVASYNKPLVILFDTCEILSPPLEEWLRDVIVCPIIERNQTTIIIVSGQHNQYRERFVDYGNGKVERFKGYADRISNPPPISWDITRFADPEIADYIRNQGLEPKQDLIDFIQELARGVPFAVQLVTEALVGLGIEYVKENFPPKDPSTFSTDEMVTLVTQKFLHHCLKEEADLARVRGLAMLRNWDEGGIKAAWQLPEGASINKDLHTLEARYSFILPDKKLHMVVREFVRQDLRIADETTARTLGKNIAQHYFPLWEKITTNFLLESVS